MREGLGEGVVEGEGSRGKPGGGAEGDEVAVQMERWVSPCKCGGHVPRCLRRRERANPSPGTRPWRTRACAEGYPTSSSTKLTGFTKPVSKVSPKLAKLVKQQQPSILFLSKLK
jgi:hypothetical protein